MIARKVCLHFFFSINQRIPANSFWINLYRARWEWGEGGGIWNFIAPVSGIFFNNDNNTFVFCIFLGVIVIVISGWRRALEVRHLNPNHHFISLSRWKDTEAHGENNEKTSMEQASLRNFTELKEEDEGNFFWPTRPNYELLGYYLTPPWLS